MNPIPVFLSIDRSRLGARRAATIFMACREAATRFCPDCRIEAVYEDRERTGWTFTVDTHLNALRLATYHQAAVAGRLVPLP